MCVQVCKPLEGHRKRVSVFFFGTHQIGHLPPENVVPYVGNKLKYGSGVRIKGFTEGMWEIQNTPGVGSKVKIPAQTAAKTKPAKPTKATPAKPTSSGSTPGKSVPGPAGPPAGPAAAKTPTRASSRLAPEKASDSRLTSEPALTSDAVSETSGNRRSRRTALGGRSQDTAPTALGGRSQDTAPPENQKEVDEEQRKGRTPRQRRLAAKRESLLRSLKGLLRGGRGRKRTMKNSQRTGDGAKKKVEVKKTSVRESTVAKAMDRKSGVKAAVCKKVKDTTQVRGRDEYHEGKVSRLKTAAAEKKTEVKKDGQKTKKTDAGKAAGGGKTKDGGKTDAGVTAGGGKTKDGGKTDAGVTAGGGKTRERDEKVKTDAGVSTDVGKTKTDTGKTKDGRKTRVTTNARETTDGGKTREREEKVKTDAGVTTGGEKTKEDKTQAVGKKGEGKKDEEKKDERKIIGKIVKATPRQGAKVQVKTIMGGAAAAAEDRGSAAERKDEDKPDKGAAGDGRKSERRRAATGGRKDKNVTEVEKDRKDKKDGTTLKEKEGRTDAEQTEEKTDETKQQRTDETKQQRTDETKQQRTDETKQQRTDETKQRTDETKQRTDETKQRTDETKQRTDETKQRTDETKQRTDETKQRTDETKQRTDETNQQKTRSDETTDAVTEETSKPEDAQAEKTGAGEDAASDGGKVEPPAGDKKTVTMTLTDSTLHRIHGDIRISLKTDNPDISKCLMALDQLSMVYVTSKHVQRHSELVATLRKLRFYRASQAVMDKASMLYNRLKNSFLVGEGEEVFPGNSSHLAASPFQCLQLCF
ncbi:lens epithelium-derived growth factor-like [Etheostoma cragini]|uniref:lens epithelium-derived growth factor-like n=1 Tax=Etheostoma cragini TaxID=417921 RepID=UPI00155E3A5F|nr:lens epithelium-derived growth factor-like [Etheostoma cragini]